MINTTFTPGISWNTQLLYVLMTKEFFSTDLSTEYQIMQKTFNLTDKMIQSLAYLSIDYIFESDSVKDRLRRYFEGWQQLNH